MTKLIVRDVRSDEINFCLNSWLKSFERHSPLQGPDYFKVFHGIVDGLLATCETKVILADSTVAGYAVSMPGRLYWVYVKHAVRQLGFANALLEEIGFNEDWISPQPSKVWQHTKLGARKIPFYLPFGTL